jgi:hypothetical protein
MQNIVTFDACHNKRIGEAQLFCFAMQGRVGAGEK